MTSTNTFKYPEEVAPLRGWAVRAYKVAKVAQMSKRKEESWERHISYLIEHGELLFHRPKEKVNLSELKGWQRYIAKRVLKGEFLIENQPKST